MRGRVWLVALVALLFTGCGDKTIALSYAPGPATPALTDARAVTVFAFRDMRGDEGDGHPNRVGGIYGGYGNQLSKVWTPTPWMRTLVNALVTGFQSRGVPTQSAADREFQAGDPSVTGYALGGDLKNFSTEARYTNSAHINAIVKLYRSDGTIDDLQRIMNLALSQFVQRVVTDPDIAARLTRD